jgi:hypothetical protein
MRPYGGGIGDDCGNGRKYAFLHVRRECNEKHANMRLYTCGIGDGELDANMRPYGGCG